MKRVLIVDDEFLVRLGLKTTINWESHGYMIAGEASNGKEALDLFDRINPDILLTDIKMPVMDGFELIEEVQKKKKGIQIVILSHYDDFAYAQKAIRVGAVQYILKSEMNEANLLELLKSLSDDSKAEASQTSSSQNKREEYLIEQLFGKPADDDFNPSSLSEPCLGLFSDRNYLMLKGFCETSLLTEDSGNMLSETVRTILNNSFEDIVTCCTYYKKQFYFTAIVPAEGALIQGVPDKVTDRVRQLMRNIRQYFDVVVQIGMSLTGKPQRFPEMIHEAELARKSCFFTEDGLGLFQKQLRSENGQIKVSHTQLSACIDENNRETLISYIQDIFNRIKSIADYSSFKNAFIDFLAIAKSICEVHQLSNVPSLPFSKFSYDTVAAMSYIDTARKYIEDLYLTIADAKVSHEPSFSPAVRACIAFIKEHFAQNISLSDASVAAEISSSYLSLIFKQETGVNFSNFLSEYRVEQAKKMLASTNKKIYEIADEVGFSSPYYFSKVFKEITGLTCKDYKDKHSKAGL